ncbi:MAG TPA: hypothetical protein VKY65_07040 [Alphaproteobacteria bacterium]|nr:hypothetical protein [Alphaproteobacteria bacterium]
MQNIDRWFVGAGIILGIAGMLMGIDMGMRQDFTLAPVHAHLNLVGWVSLLLFGLAYRAGLARSDGWATAHFWIALAGAIIFPIGISVAITAQQPALAIVGALLSLLSMLLFLANFLRARAA